MKTIRFLALAILTFVAYPWALGAQHLSRDDAFTRTVRLTGERYQMARDLLAREGKAIVPFLEAKLLSADWHERDVAAAVLARIAHPKEAREIERLCNGYPSTWEWHKDDSLRITFSQAELDWYLRNKQPAPVAGITLTRAMIPMLHEIFRVESGLGSSYQRGSAQTVALLADWHAVESIPVILRWRSTIWLDSERLIPHLVNMGPKAVPYLRDAVHADGIGAPVAAQALGQLGDAELAPLFMERLHNPKQLDRHAAYAKALSRLKHPSALPALLYALERAAQAERTRASTSNRPRYDELRADVLAFGKAAISVLRERGRADAPLAARVIARSLLWRIEHPEEWSKLQPLLDAQMNVYASRVGFYGRRGDDWNVEDVWTDDSVKRLNWPAALRLEYAYVNADDYNLAPLALMKNEPLAFEVLASTLTKGKAWESAAVLGMMAELQDERALAVFKDIAVHPSFSHYEWMPGWLLTLNNKKGIPILDALASRIASEIQIEKDLAHRKRLEALLPVVKAVQAALAEDRDALVKQLEDPTLRRIAAGCLARQRDVRAIAPLIAAMASARADEDPPGYALSRWRRDAMLDGSERGLIVGMGAEALPVLEKLQNESSDRSVKVLCESCRLRIEQPKLAYKYQAACDAGMARVYMPMIPDFHGGGAIVANAVGKPAVPLLEASLLLGTDLNPICAAYALGMLKEERSIDIVVKAMPSLSSYRGFVGGSVLAMFGPKGIEAAKKIPPPDPRKANYGERAMRSRGATQALVAADDPKSIENLLEFFNRPIPKKDTKEYPEWTTRVHAYLDMAKQLEDSRLKEPILNLLGQHDDRFTFEIYEALLLQKDQRLVEHALRQLEEAPLDKYWEYNKLFTLLAVQLEMDLPKVLMRKYRAAKDEKTRDRVLFAFEKLAAWESGNYWAASQLSYMIRNAQSVYARRWPGSIAEIDARNSPNETAEFQARAREAQLTRRQEQIQALRGPVQTALHVALVELLKDTLDAPLTPRAETRIKLMTSIIRYGSADERKLTVKKLTDWLKTQPELHEGPTQYLYYVDDPLVTQTFIEMYGKWPHEERARSRVMSLVKYRLERDKDPQMTRTILKLYRDGGCNDDGLASILGERKVIDALDDLAKHARHAPSYTVIHALSRFGEPGEKRVLTAYGQAKEKSARWTFLIAVSHHRYAPKTLFDDFAPEVRALLTVPVVPNRTWGYVSSHVDPLQRVDARRTYLLLAECFFNAREEEVQKQIVDYLRRMEANQPSLREATMSLAQ